MYDLCPQLVGITELLLRLLNVVKMDDEFEDEKGGEMNQLIFVTVTVFTLL